MECENCGKYFNRAGKEKLCIDCWTLKKQLAIGNRKLNPHSNGGNKTTNGSIMSGNKGQIKEMINMNKKTMELQEKINSLTKENYKLKELLLVNGIHN